LAFSQKKGVSLSGSQTLAGHIDFDETHELFEHLINPKGQVDFTGQCCIESVQETRSLGHNKLFLAIQVFRLASTASSTLLH